MIEIVGVILLFFLGIFGVSFGVLLVIWFVRLVLGPRRGAAPATPQQHDTGMTAEEEGNVHSGPYGYSPMTLYPETQYGSLFNPDAEWNHEEQ